MRKRTQRRGVAASASALLLFLALPGCSPTFDWRQSRPEGAGVVMMFPCRPERQERTARVGAAELHLQLHSCRAGGATFSLAMVEGTLPGDVSALLAALRNQALANLRGVASAAALPPVAGATPNEQSGTLRIVGRGADGRPVVAHAAFFVKGVRLYQATVLDTDDAVGDEVIETFFTSIRPQ